jgi:hypothetical protein
MVRAPALKPQVGKENLPMKTVRLLFCVVLLVTPALAQKNLSAAETREHVGENATVCGEVASTHYAAKSRGNPTFINLDKPYPSQIFTLLIWGSDRSKFGDPEQRYQDQHICVTGDITEYRGVSQIIASDPSQVRVQK